MFSWLPSAKKHINTAEHSSELFIVELWSVAIYDFHLGYLVDHTGISCPQNVIKFLVDKFCAMCIKMLYGVTYSKLHNTANFPSDFESNNANPVVQLYLNKTIVRLYQVLRAVESVLEESDFQGEFFFFSGTVCLFLIFFSTIINAIIWQDLLSHSWLFSITKHQRVWNPGPWGPIYGARGNFNAQVVRDWTWMTFNWQSVC